MIRPSVGRPDLEYLYHCFVSTWALLEAEDREAFETNGNPSINEDGESPYSELTWVKIHEVSFAKATIEEAVATAMAKIAPQHIKQGEYYYHFQDVRFVSRKVLTRTTIFITHQAIVEPEMWTNEVPEESEDED